MSDVSVDVLADYALEAGERVEVELLVVGLPSQVAPQLVTGIATGATPAVLILSTSPGDRLVRIPWRAIATIRTTLTHPAHD